MIVGMNKKRVLKATTNIVIFILIVLVILIALPYLTVYFFPFVIGYIIALLANPVVRFLEKTFRIKRKFGTVIVVLFTISIIIGLLYGIGLFVYSQIEGFRGMLPDLMDNFNNKFEITMQNLELFLSKLPIKFDLGIGEDYTNFNDMLADFGKSLAVPTVVIVKEMAKKLPTTVISIIMGILAAYFFIAEREYIPGLYEKVFSYKVRGRMKLVHDNVIGTILGYCKAQLKIEAIMYVILLIGLLILKVPYAPLIALGMAIVDILPFFGTAIILVPWAAIELLLGNYVMAIGLIAIWGIGQVIRQLIQPKILGDTVGLPAIPTLVLLYIGYKAMGMFGMIISIPVGMALIKLYEVGAFNTFIYSVKLLAKVLNGFRKITKEDIEYINKKEEIKDDIEVTEEESSEQ